MAYTPAPRCATPSYVAAARRSIIPVRYLLVLLCFVLSGFAALLYETAWTRELGFLFGSSEIAVAAVLAAYMGGVAAGAGVAARFAHRVRRPVLVVSRQSRRNLVPRVQIASTTDPDRRTRLWTDMGGFELGADGAELFSRHQDVDTEAISERTGFPFNTAEPVAVTGTPEREYLEACRRGNAGAYRPLVDAYYARLVRVAHALVGNVVAISVLHEPDIGLDGDVSTAVAQFKSCWLVQTIGKDFAFVCCAVIVVVLEDQHFVVHLGLRFPVRIRCHRGHPQAALVVKHIAAIYRKHSRGQWLCLGGSCGSG